MIDHISFAVRDFAVSRVFYTSVLATLGAKPLANDGQWIGFGRDSADFWIGPLETSIAGSAVLPMHIAFVARSRQEVNDFYSAALANGATDNGAPGLRDHYHENYYGAFVLDPDGHNVEAVCHLAQ